MIKVQAGAFRRVALSLGAAAVAAAIALSVATPAIAAQDTVQDLEGDARVYRLAGDDALGTMEKITNDGFSAASCDYLVIATMGGYWDALTSSGLAGLLDCPVLMTDGNSLSAQTKSEIERLANPDGVSIYIAGGPFAVSEQVYDQIFNMGLYMNIDCVERVYGEDSLDTALKIYEKGAELGTWGDTCIVSTAGGYWDALAISPYAYAKNAPIFLAGPGAHALTDGVMNAILEGGFSHVIITGGEAAVYEGIQIQICEESIPVTRLCGDTAVDTSTAIATWCVKNAGMNPTGTGFATVNGYYDALAGASLCGSLNAPLVLISDEQQQAITGFATSYGKCIQYCYVFGGTFAVSSTVYNNLVNTLAGLPYDSSVNPKDVIVLDIQEGIEPFDFDEADDL